MKDALQAPPSTLDVLKSLHSIPWTLKPLYGVLSDTVPIFGYRRRSYLVLSAALGAAVWASLALLQPSLGITMACVVLEAVSGAFSDVVVDSLVVARARASPAPEAGALQSMCWASKSVGVILSSYTSGWLIQRGGPRLVFLVTAVVPLIVGAAALTIPERATPSRQGFQRLSGGEDPAPSLRPPKTPSPGFDRGTRLLPSPCRTSCDGSDRRRTDPRLQTAGGIAKHGNVSSGEALSAPGAPPVTEGDACSVAENDGLESVADGTGVASEGSTQGWGVRVEKKSKDTAEAPLNAVGAGRRVVGGGEGEWRGGRGEDEGGEAAGEGKTKGMGAKAEREAWEREAGGGRGMMEEKEAGETDALLAVADGNAESTHVAVRDSAPSFGSAVCGPAAGPPASRIRTGPQPEPGSGNASRDEAVPDGRAILGGEPLDAGVGGVTRRLVHALLDRRILVPLVFLFLWAASPSPSSGGRYAEAPGVLHMRAGWMPVCLLDVHGVDAGLALVELDVRRRQTKRCAGQVGISGSLSGGCFPMQCQHALEIIARLSGTSCVAAVAPVVIRTLIF